MNKNILIVVTILIFALAVGGYLVFGKDLSQKVKPSSSGQMQSEALDAGSPKSIRTLLESTSPQKCSFKDNMENIEMNGVIYIANKKMRGDYDSNILGKQMITHLIYDGDFTYMWTEGDIQGYKIANKQEVPNEVVQETKQQVDIDKLMDIHCDNWLVDEQVFALPAGINFVDIKTMIPTGLSQPTATASQQEASQPAQEGKDCSVCDNVPQEVQGQCLTAMGCN